MSTVTAPKQTTSKFSTLKVGSVFSETQYYKVQKIVGDEVQVLNDSNEDIILTEAYIDQCVDLAHHYDKEEVKNRTELTQIFLSHPFTAMTVNFNKQVKKEDVVAEIQTAYENSTPREFTDKMKKSISKALVGEERTAVGRHYGTTNEFGRVPFTDMEKERGNKPDWDGRSIQVDPRTLNWLIVKGVKYKVK